MEDIAESTGIAFLKRKAPEIYLQKEIFNTYLWYT